MSPVLPMTATTPFAAMFALVLLLLGASKLPVASAAGELRLCAWSHAPSTQRFLVHIEREQDVRQDSANRNDFTQFSDRERGRIQRMFARARVANGFVWEVQTLSSARAAADLPYVTLVEEDCVFTATKPGGSGGGGGGSSGEIVDWGVQRVLGLPSMASGYDVLSVAGAPGAVDAKLVWVVDTGISVSNSDLNTRFDLGFTVFTKRGQPVFDDENGHGTHVAGTAAAIAANAKGTAGVAPGREVVPVRVLDRRGSGYMSDIIAGIEHIISRASAGDVVNLSLGGGISPTLDAAVAELADSGIRVAIAAGNSNVDVSNTSPARIVANGPYPNVWVVSAHDSTLRKASFSNFGAFTIWAPGYRIEASGTSDGSTDIMDGTSMAAPHVAGLLALMGTSADLNGLNSDCGDVTSVPSGASVKSICL